MLFSNIAIIDENFTYIPHAWVGVRGDKIEFISTSAPSTEVADTYEEVYDGHNKLLMTAFYNAHSHVSMTMLRGYAEGLPLHEWLNDMIWPFEEKMTGEDAYWATLLGCAEMARYGVVSFSDMYMFTPERARAVAESGMKANLCQHFVEFNASNFEDIPLYAPIHKWIDEYHNSCKGRIKMDYCIHGEYTVNAATIKGIAKAAKEHGLGIQAHVSESKREHDECKARHDGKTPIQLFESLGALEVPFTAAHCVWVEDCDIEIMSKKNVYVSTNPAANLKLGSGFAPTQKMLSRGVNLALGTDGVASNNNHDIMQDMYLMATLSKGYNLDPTAVSEVQALRAATLTGALSQGRKDCGALKTGNKADLVVLDTSGPSWQPAINPVANLVYSGHGSDVCLTMCDGVVIYRDNCYPTINLEEAVRQVNERATRVIKELAR